MQTPTPEPSSNTPHSHGWYATLTGQTQPQLSPLSKVCAWFSTCITSLGRAVVHALQRLALPVHLVCAPEHWGRLVGIFSSFFASSFFGADHPTFALLSLSLGIFLSLRSIFTIRHQRNMPTPFNPNWFDIWTMLYGVYCGIMLLLQMYVLIAKDMRGLVLLLLGVCGVTSLAVRVSGHNVFPQRPSGPMSLFLFSGQMLLPILMFFSLLASLPHGPLTPAPKMHGETERYVYDVTDTQTNPPTVTVGVKLPPNTRATLVQDAVILIGTNAAGEETLTRWPLRLDEASAVLGYKVQFAETIRLVR